jgi:hypothetical protein
MLDPITDIAVTAAVKHFRRVINSAINGYWAFFLQLATFK